jgi:hypothetical protein
MSERDRQVGDGSQRSQIYLLIQGRGLVVWPGALTRAVKYWMDSMASLGNITSQSLLRSSHLKGVRFSAP